MYIMFLYYKSLDFFKGDLTLPLPNRGFLNHFNTGQQDTGGPYKHIGNKGTLHMAYDNVNSDMCRRAEMYIISDGSNPNFLNRTEL
jgi:hypothetical protein